MPPDAVYLLDGERVPGSSFQFIDGLILRTLEIYTDSATMARYGAGRGVVIGDILPDRVPLVVFNGAFSSIESWLKMCRADAFSVSADVRCTISTCFPSKPCRPMGVRGKYGCDLHRHRGVISARRIADDEELLAPARKLAPNALYRAGHVPRQ